MVDTATTTTITGLPVAGLSPLTTRVPYGNTGIPVSRLCWGTGLMAVLKHNLSHEDAAAILSAQGIPVHMFPDPQPTPVCAFAVADLGAAAGANVHTLKYLATAPGDEGEERESAEE